LTVTVGDCACAAPAQAMKSKVASETTIFILIPRMIGGEQYRAVVELLC
jgi:hypothetical protein